MKSIIPFIIGISGNSTVGKDLFADLFIKELGQKHNVACFKTPFAYELKNDLKDFVKTKCGLDIWNLSPEDKKALRPILVAYGTEFMRNKHKGQHWIRKVKKRIDGYCAQNDLFNKSDRHIFLVPDVRFKQYPYDELDYIKENGVLVFIDKFEDIPEGEPDVVGSRIRYTQPANKHESQNNLILREKADYSMKWKNCEGNIDKINQICLLEVQKFIKWLQEKQFLKLNE